MKELEQIAELSRLYGADPRFTLAGGGNTSCKDERYLYVKPSGVALATIRPEDFVKMERAVIRECFTWGEFATPAEREERIKQLMAFAVRNGERRASVEAPVHEIMPHRFVVHMHPALVNGLTCARDGAAACAELFPDALWIGYCDPGYTLSKHVFDEINRATEKNGRAPAIIMLQNHGVFVGGDTPEEIRAAYDRIMTTLEKAYAARGVKTTLETAAEADDALVQSLAPQLRGLLGESVNATVVSAAPFAAAPGPLTPDHIVYNKAFALVVDSDDEIADAVAKFKAQRGYLPRVVSVSGRALFAAGKNRNAAETVLALARNGALILQLTAAFGGVNYLSDAQRQFIENWEVESYRAKVAAGSGAELTGMVAVVTGGAQGFGNGIAVELAKAGADVVIADLNAEGANAAAAALGKGASGIAVNIADEDSVAQLVAEVVRRYGGCDLLVANAGVARAGSVKEFALRDWKFVTDVNYIGFFLCCKHFSRLMAMQNRVSGRWSDIVQVNSKSGLVGSKNNGAYAGSKFGGVGLVQSFALELIADRIKVNAICPGNFLDGPLWSDPERGLFVQYLAAGKVPGAKNVADVRRHYESLVPMGRGCFPADVARAIIYAVRQGYETGQAIPVTGGQVMLS